MRRFAVVRRRFASLSLFWQVFATNATVLALATAILVLGPFTVSELKTAREAFLTSTSSHVLPVTSVDGARIGDGRPGPVTMRLRELYLAALEGP